MPDINLTLKVTGDVGDVIAKLRSVGIEATTMGAAIKSADVGGVAAGANAAAHAIDGLSFATAGAFREFIVLGHEVISGNFSRIPGSILVLGERMRGLHLVAEALSGGFGIAAGAAVAFGAAAAYAGYQLFQGYKAVQDTTDRLTLLGQGFEFNRATITDWRNQLQSDFGLSSSAVRQLADEFLKLPPSMTGLIPQLERAAVGLNAFTHVGVDKAGKEIASAFDRGALAAAKFVEENAMLGRG